MDVRSSTNDTARRRAAPGRAAVARLDPADLAALGDLEFVARSVVEGFLIGLHRSPHRGFSVEFAENRPYVPGDDVRHVDWRMYARSDRYYVKQYEEETNLRAYLAVDTSLSMDWTSEPGRWLAKLEYARVLTASLAYLLLRQGDAVGLLAFDDRIRIRVPPRGTRRHLRTLLGSLARLRGSGTTDAGGAIREVALRMRRRGLVVLISDLLVEPDQTLRALHFLRHRGHEVLVFHLMDPGERDLPQVGDAVFFDPEDEAEIRTDTAGLRPEYQRAVDEAVRSWRLECRRMGADYHLFTTDTPLGVVLGEYLEKRSRLG
ncbi:MAG: DUF58 domain-containing protein [Gemmatimonadetes bacterium]|nr:DUF58 domain-containing protein [Gemmatimonadota bacterium]MBT8477453.1 DUF58 domain-containing protein [Gemmatimonadota bacterium]NNK48144.1 DUF58 domain-containing protein [Gemmatimonadota bacterium]